MACHMRNYDPCRVDWDRDDKTFYHVKETVYNLHACIQCKWISLNTSAYKDLL